MALTKITQEDTNNKGVIGLPDTPNLTTQAMQEKFDELALDVIVPKHNGLIDELEAGTAAASLGAVDPLGEATTIQAMLNRQAESGYTKAETDALLSNKVDTEVGKGLSTYDFSEAYKTKLNNIEDNANNYVLPKGTQSELGGVMGDGSTFTIDENGVGHAVGGGGGGTADYEALINKPKLNDKALIGDKQSEEYGILRPYIKVTSDAGSTVTITKGTETITLTQVSGSSTEWEGHPTSYGTWTVKSVLAGADDATTTVTVDAVKTYAVTVSHISATITVTYPVGSTYCKLSKGALEYTATQNPQTFTVRSIGTWNIEVEYNGVVKTATAIISADGDSQSVTVEYATITVNYGNDFKGKTITCTDGSLTYTKTAPSDASTVSFTIPTTGTWTISASASGTPYSVSQVVSAYTTYTVTLEVFSATVTITFPYSNGATCTISDGDTTLTATESPMAFTIPNTGTWVATCVLDGQSKTQSFTITTDGQTESGTFEYGTINLTFDNEFRGLTITCANGGTVISKTAPISGNTMAFYPPSTGEWTISATYSGVPYSTSATVVSLSTAVSAILQMNITVNVTMYGAAGATISYTDINGAQTQTLDNTGSKANVSISVSPNSPTITFTDTNVAKDPSDLSANYTKSVTITNNMTEVYVMPDGAIYWYGFNSGIGGGLIQGYSYGGDNWIFNTNSASVGGTGVSDLITKNTIDLTNYISAKAILTVVSNNAISGADFVTTTSTPPTEGGNAHKTNYLNIRQSITDSLQTLTLSDKSQARVAIIENANGIYTSLILYAMWLE